MERWSDGMTLRAVAPKFHCSKILFHYLTLALFVAGVGTDHPDNAFAADDFAIFAKLFD